MTFQVVTDSGVHQMPAIGSWWQHRNGSLYQVYDYTNLSDRQEEYPATVHYRGTNGMKWSKPLTKWYDSMSSYPEVVCEFLKTQENSNWRAEDTEHLMSMLEQLSVVQEFK